VYCGFDSFEAPVCLGLEVDKGFDVFFAVASSQFWMIVSPATDVYDRLVVALSAEKIAERVRKTRYVLELIEKENVTSRGLSHIC